MSHDPERPSRFSWLLRLYDRDQQSFRPALTLRWEQPESEPDRFESDAPELESEDFPGWDTMIMALMA